MASPIARFAVKSARNVLIPKQGLLQAQNVRCMSGANPTIQKKQEHFQSPDETPVYVKGGPMDQILYRTTMGACLLAIGMFIYNMADMALPAKK